MGARDRILVGWGWLIDFILAEASHERERVALHGAIRMP